MGKFFIGHEMCCKGETHWHKEAYARVLFKRYFHGLDSNIIQIVEHLFIIVIAIWDRLVKCWEYVDYIPFVR
jgi:hypothetical protein